MQKYNLKRLFWGGFLLVITVLGLVPAYEAKADEPYVVVIDPGHGGENLGAQYDGYVEKEMTMTVAKAMKKELERYEGVIVYLTHENDVDMSIKERAHFASRKKADYFFSLHFNASVNHNLYGAEVWVPAYTDFYVLGRQFAEIEMDLLTDLGLHSRGIKTRLNNLDEDYYGVLRYCTEEGIPSALIEHCHMDHANDKIFYQKNKEQLEEFGRLDARAVAQFLGLASAELNVDYSTYPLAQIERPARGKPVRPDKTAPEEISIEILSMQEKTGEVSVRMKASDADGYIQYYNYSLDGGKTYSELLKWPRPFWNQSDEELIFTVTVPIDREIHLVAKAYNGYDGFKDSNTVVIPILEKPKQAPAKEQYEEVRFKPLSYAKEKNLFGLNFNDKVLLIVLILVISFFMAWILFILIKMINMLNPNNKRRRRR